MDEPLLRATFYGSIEDFYRWDKIPSEIEQTTLFQYVFKGEMFFYILATAEINTFEENKQKLIPLELDEVKELHAYEVVKVEITLDRWAGLKVNLGNGEEEPLRFENPPAPIVFSREIEMDNVFVKRTDIEPLLTDSDPRPKKLKAANRAWKELFSKGIKVSQGRRKSQMEMAKEWLGEKTDLSNNSIEQVARLICNNRSTKKIIENIPSNIHDNRIIHPLYANSLKIANDCWNELFNNDNNPTLRRGPKILISKWLEKNHPKLSKREIKLITIIVNPHPEGGAPRI